MNDCETRQEDLKAYLDGELPLSRRVALRWHLMRCALCREERDAMIEISRSFKTGEDDTLDPSLRDRILSSVTYSAADPDTSPVRQRRRSSPMLFVWGAAAAGVLAGVFLRPILLSQPTVFSKIAAPAAPSSVNETKHENAKQSTLPYSQSVGGAPASAPSPAKSSAILPVAGQRGKADNFASPAGSVFGKNQVQEPTQKVEQPALATENSIKPNLKSLPLNNRADSTSAHADSPQDNLLNGSAAAKPNNTLNDNTANSRQSAVLFQRRHSLAEKKAAVKAAQRARGRNVTEKGQHQGDKPSSQSRK